MKETKTCGECKWYVDGPKYGVCVCQVPIWVSVVQNFKNALCIQPSNNQAESCACFEKKEG